MSCPICPECEGFKVGACKGRKEDVGKTAGCPLEQNPKCKNCAKINTCDRPIRRMASDEELEHIVCIEWQKGANVKTM